jgi:CheY-like chemotaxis protein
MKQSGQAGVIMYAEDNLTDAELTLRAFRKANIADQVLWLKDGQQVLDYLFPNPSAGGERMLPRLLLLDLKMPKVDGLQVLKAVRGNPLARALPIVILTSSAEESDLRCAYESGANSYIIKPTDFKQLLEEVARLSHYWLTMNRLPACP